MGLNSWDACSRDIRLDKQGFIDLGVFSQEIRFNALVRTPLRGWEADYLPEWLIEAQRE